MESTIQTVAIDLLNQALKDGLKVIVNTPNGEIVVTGAISTENEIVLFTEND